MLTLLALLASLAAAQDAPIRGAVYPAARAVKVPAGAVVRTVETVADMLAAQDLTDGLCFDLKGYHLPGDGGGGLFRYDAASTKDPDGGTVLKPQAADGRFLRLFDADAEVYAEWFGAWGDGDKPDAHADQQAINACLRTCGRVKLLAKTYGVRGAPDPYNPAAVYHAVELGPSYLIEGAGRDATTLKLLDGTNPMGAAPGENYFQILANRAFHESADYCVVRDLTINCNFDGQDKRTTIHAIGVRGGGVLVERVNFRGYGTGRNPDGGSSRECFVIHQSLVFKDPKGCRQAAILRDLDFTDCGHNGNLEGGVAEITHVALGGADNFEDKSWIMPQGKDPAFDPANGGENENNWWPSYGGVVENCTIHDEVFDPATQKSPLNGITYGDCIGMTVRNNHVTNWDGTAVFTMSWWNRSTLITGNRFDGVAAGIALAMMGQDAKPIQCPRHRDVLIEGNTIRTGAPLHFPYAPCGIHLYGQDLPPEARMENIVVRGNVISGRAYQVAEGGQRCPSGISVQILRANYRNLVFEDNVLDFPDFAEGSWIPQEPHALAMTYYPLARWEEDAKAGNVTFRNNHGPEGQRLTPILQDWYYKNPPTRGLPAVK